MSFLDRELRSRPSTGEAPFGLEEVFFSRTDSRGVIQAGNQVFSRVAGFTMEEMVGAPHKIVRHPDMPRGVFQILWDQISAGNTVGAYVKNRAKDGPYYWVFAVVSPCEDGYLSARIKPTSALHTVVEAEYANLLLAETEQELTPQESAEILLARLNELGFADYEAFCGHALNEELKARDLGLGRPVDPRLTSFNEMLEAAGKLVGETASLVQDFDATRTTPHNLRVIASRIEPAGGPVTVLSENYGVMSREMSRWFESHVMSTNSEFSAIKGIVNRAMFMETLARILAECSTQLTQEIPPDDSICAREEIRILSALEKTQMGHARSSLRAVAQEAGRIMTACETMHRQFLGLTTTRVLCKIESARLGPEGNSLDAIIDELGVFQDRISKRLETMAGLGRSIQTGEDIEK